MHMLGYRVELTYDLCIVPVYTVMSRQIKYFRLAWVSLDEEKGGIRVVASFFLVVRS